MAREDVLRTSGYWITKIQVALYNCAYSFMKENNKNRTQLAEHLGVTKGYVTQLLNGDYDHKLSKLVDLSLAFGYVPQIDFIPIEEYCEIDKIQNLRKQQTYESVINEVANSSYSNVDYYVPQIVDCFKEVA
ncbi:MAG: helix-turn-helix transcriptional regulator [Bacteroidaceae bacterium]|nr:helix-turn-helix transcriptional regulator [Bacteroidaceae bacterium]